MILIIPPERTYLFEDFYMEDKTNCDGCRCSSCHCAKLHEDISEERECRRDDPLEEWPEFVSMIRGRLERGRTDYGDRSFTRNPEGLAFEIRQELADVAGWAFILWSRLRRIDWNMAQPSMPIGERLKTELEN